MTRTGRLVVTTLLIVIAIMPSIGMTRSYLSMFELPGNIEDDTDAVTKPKWRLRTEACDHARMEKQNREQRRQAKFGGGRANEKGSWPTSEPNPVFGGAEAPEDATAGRPDQDQTKMTGTGTGGATESPDRMPENEATHGGNSAKG